MPRGRQVGPTLAGLFPGQPVGTRMAAAPGRMPFGYSLRLSQTLPQSSFPDVYPDLQSQQRKSKQCKAGGHRASQFTCGHVDS